MNFEGVIAEIVECEERLRAAQLASDVGQLDALIADELVFVDGRGQLVTKMMDLESHQSGMLKLVSSEFRDQQILPLNEESAVAIVHIGLVGSYGGEEFVGAFRYTRVWQRRAQGWCIVAGHMSAVV